MIMTDFQKIEWWLELNKDRIGLCILLDQLKEGGTAWRKDCTIEDVENKLKETEKLMNSIVWEGKNRNGKEN